MHRTPLILAAGLAAFCDLCVKSMLSTRWPKADGLYCNPQIRKGRKEQEKNGMAMARAEFRLGIFGIQSERESLAECHRVLHLIQCIAPILNNNSSVLNMQPAC